MGAITGAIWGGGWRENAGKTPTARVLMATAWVRAPSMERMGSRAALRAGHHLARSLRCEPRLWQRPQSARAEADLTRLGWQCGQRRSLCVAAQRSRLVFSGPLHGCLGCQGARTHTPTTSRGAVAGFVPFSSRAHSAPPPCELELEPELEDCSVDCNCAQPRAISSLGSQAPDWHHSGAPPRLNCR